MEKQYTRKEVSKMLEIGNEALRYYEKIGIIPMPSRSQSNYRLYAEDDLLRLRFIIRLKELGFSLSEIVLIFQMLNNDKVRNKEILRSQIEAKIEEIDKKIATLTELKEILNLSKDNPGLGECSYLNLFYKTS